VVEQRRELDVVDQDGDELVDTPVPIAGSPDILESRSNDLRGRRRVAAIGADLGLAVRVGRLLIDADGGDSALAVVGVAFDADGGWKRRAGLSWIGVAVPRAERTLCADNTVVGVASHHNTAHASHTAQHDSTTYTQRHSHSRRTIDLVYREV
jgi:hypothetical protein